MQTAINRIGALWNRGCLGKAIVGFLALMLCGIIGSVGQAIGVIPTPTPTPVAQQLAAPTAALEPTAAPEPEEVAPTAAPAEPTAAPEPTAEATEAPTAGVEPTEAPAEPTAAPEPTEVVVLTEAPTVEDSPEARYVRIAQEGLTIPSTRPAMGLPDGEWKAEVVTLENGPEVTLTFPLGPGLTNEQTVRQAQRQCAQVVKALFDADPALARVTAFGTLPDGAGSTELGAVSIFVTRDQYAAWDGVAENLGEWRIAPRYQ